MDLYLSEQSNAHAITLHVGASIQSMIILTFAAWDPTKPLAGPCPPSYSVWNAEIGEDQVRIPLILINRGESWNISSVFFPVFDLFTCKHTPLHRHSDTVSSISAATRQQVSEDRGLLCAGLSPLLLHLWPPLFQKTGCREWANSPYISLISMHQSLSISPLSPLYHLSIFSSPKY